MSHLPSENTLQPFIQDVELVLDWLRQLPPTGGKGFEGLVAALLSRLTGQTWHLARTGSQAGRDLGTYPGVGIRAVVECKRYRSDQPLDETELLGKLTEATPQSGHRVDAWILAVTRSASEQLVAKLTNEAWGRGVTVAILDAPSDRLGRLVALVASYPEVLKLGAPEWKPPPPQADALRRIRSQADFNLALADLRSTFDLRTLGFVGVRTALTQSFVAALSDPTASRALFGQRVLPASALMTRRRHTDEQLDAWWTSWSGTGYPVLIHGTEGSGKTWALAAWAGRLLDAADAPLVVWCSWNHFEPLPVRELIASLIAQQLRAQEGAFFARRLENWASARAERPAVLFVLDGLNEISASLWRPWLSSAARDLQESLPGVALAVTTRTATLPDLSAWLDLAKARTSEETLLSTGETAIPTPAPPHHPPVTIEVTDFDTDELLEALQRAGVHDWTPPERLQSLMRKPKWFARALAMRERLLEVGDPTVERLLWEDMKLRYQERDSAPLTDREFAALLIELARGWRPADGPITVSTGEVARSLSAVADVHRAIEELISSEILIPVVGSSDLTIDPERLPHALGLVLLEVAARVTGSGADAVGQAIEREIEELGDSDLSAAVVAFAVCAALASDGRTRLPDEVVLNVLSALARLRNGATSWDRSRPWSFFPLRPVVFLRLAEEEWSREEWESSARQRLAYCFAWIGELYSSHPQLIAACERWLGLVHPQGFSHRENLDAEVLERLEAVESALSDLRPITIARATTAAELHLAQVALLVASNSRTAAYALAIANWALSRAVLDEPAEATEVEWLVRRAADPLREQLVATASRLEALPLQAAWAAAALLYRLEKSRSSLARAQKLVPHREWERRERTIQSPRDARFAARELAHDALDPQRQLAFPYTALALSDLSSANVYRGFQATSQSIDLEQMDATLCRAEPVAWADFYRPAALDWVHGVEREESERDNHSIRNAFLLLNDDDIAEVQRTAQRIWPTQSSRKSNVEWKLSDIALAGTPRASDQLAYLLERPGEGGSLDWLDLLTPPSPSELEKSIDALANAPAPERVRRMLFPWPPGFALTEGQRESIWAAIASHDLGNLSGTPALRARDEELLRRCVSHGVYAEDRLSDLLSSEEWMRASLVDRAQDRWLGFGSRSWLIEQAGLSRAAVTGWVDELERGFSAPPQRSVIGPAESFSSATLEVVLELRPEAVARWVDAVVRHGELGHRLVDLEFGLLEALSIALVNRNDPRVLELIDALRPGRYFVQHTQSVLELPFLCKRTATAQRVLVRALDLALNDSLLQSLCMLAEKHASTDWLQEVAESTQRADQRFELARTLAIVGLGPPRAESFQRLTCVARDEPTWVACVAEWGLRQLDSHRWARHWFREFLHQPDSSHAWAAYRLFTHCRSRMSGTWMRHELDGAQDHPDHERRRRHLLLNLHALNRTLEEKAKEMEKRLFGWLIPTSDVSPWKETWNID